MRWMGVLRLLAGVAVLGACNRNVAPPRTVLAQYEGPVRSRDVITGLNIYQTICAVCHAGRVNPAGYHWSPGQMRQQIRRGNRLMPPLGHELLSDGQVEAVLAYLIGTHAVDGELPPLTAEDVARERRRQARRRVAREERREALTQELDPALRPAEADPPSVPSLQEQYDTPEVDSSPDRAADVDTSPEAGDSSPDRPDSTEGTAEVGGSALAPPQ